MDRNQAISLVRDTFNQRFDESRFANFIRNLVNHLDESKKQVWSLKKVAFEGFVNHFMRLGTYSDPRGDRVDVLVIHLRKETTLARGRVTLRNFVADYLTTGHGQGKAAVIAAFVSPTEEDWRFSFVKLDYTIETTELGFVTERTQLTPARRYSYLVGKNENCHTAQKQFLELLQTDFADPTVDALEAAFGVEKVTKEFFEHYRNLFETSRDALNKFLKSAPDIVREFDERGITADDFTKKLLGQIVFLYFLQKKGWFGVDRGQAWGSGRRDFIRHLFKERASYSSLAATKSGRTCNFFNDILEPLFYDALSRPRLEEDHYYPSFDCRIPFLNGGLFEPLYGYKWVETDILLPDALFSNDEPTNEGDSGTGILDVFDRYNFTVNEAEPLEKEVAVDPEMLGKVFENLLPENIRHSSGTYYTPRVIVHYMCQQALLHYLTARASIISQDDLTVFLRLAERFADFEATDTKAHEDKRLPVSISQNAELLDDLLASITVCDPAIGSGAFPVGMMHEIVRARMALTPALVKIDAICSSDSDKSRSAYVLKRHAIHYSLYGVDEDPGAVEIAKLRLWLSMVVDEDEIGDIQPLPNLDYKIMQGNSLLEEFDGISLLDERLFQQMEVDRPNPRIAELENRQNWVQKEVLRLHAAGKLTKKLSTDLKNEAARLDKERKSLMNPAFIGSTSQIDLPLGSRESLKHIQQLHDDFFKESSRAQKEKLREELERLEWEFMRATLREQGCEQAIADLERASAKHRKPFFLWKLHFAEVFQKRNGFDVVIGNPPYVRIQEIKKLDSKMPERLKTQYLAAKKGNYDVYVVFIEKALRLLGPQGNVAFIQPHKFFLNKYGEPLRELLANGQHVRAIVHFGDHQVFPGATNYVCLLFLTKTGNDNFRFVLVDDLDGWYSTMQGSERLFPSNTLSQAEWVLPVGLTAKVYDRIATEKRRLGEITDLFVGLQTDADDVFIVEMISESDDEIIARSEFTGEKHIFEKKHLKPFLKGSLNIRRYKLDDLTKRLIFPYEIVNNRSVIISAEDYAVRFPKTWAYLVKCKERLTARGGGKLGNEWHGYVYKKNHTRFEQPKLLAPAIAAESCFAADLNGKFYFVGSGAGGGGGYGIVVNDEEINSLALLGILNSTVSTFYLRVTSTPFRGGYFALTKQFIEHLPVPDMDTEKQLVLERLVEYLLFINQSGAANGVLVKSTDGTLLAGYFQQWVNALVYELFFSDELHRVGLNFFKIAEMSDLRPLSEIENGQELNYLNIKFEELYSPSHPLRQSIYALDSIEEVRIIEGKA